MCTLHTLCTTSACISTHIFICSHTVATVENTPCQEASSVARKCTFTESLFLSVNLT